MDVPYGAGTSGSTTMRGAKRAKSTTLCVSRWVMPCTWNLPSIELHLRLQRRGRGRARKCLRARERGQLFSQHLPADPEVTSSCLKIQNGPFRIGMPGCCSHIRIVEHIGIDEDGATCHRRRTYPHGVRTDPQGMVQDQEPGTRKERCPSGVTTASPSIVRILFPQCFSAMSATWCIQLFMSIRIVRSCKTERGAIEKGDRSPLRCS